MNIHFVTVEISIIRRTNTLIKPERPTGHNPGPMRHNTHPMQGRLPIKQNGISILYMSFNDIPNLQLIRNLPSIRILQINLDRLLREMRFHNFNKVGTRVILGALTH